MMLKQLSSIVSAVRVCVLVASAMATSISSAPVAASPKSDASPKSIASPKQKNEQIQTSSA